MFNVHCSLFIARDIFPVYVTKRPIVVISCRRQQILRHKAYPLEKSDQKRPKKGLNGHIFDIPAGVTGAVCPVIYFNRGHFSVL